MKRTVAPALVAAEDVVLRVIGGEATFDEGLRAVLSYQADFNAPLADWWRQRGFDPTAADVSAAAIPGVPTDVFRHVRLVSTEADVVRVFRTSGTTSGARGEAHRLSTRCYDAGALGWFERLVLPDAARPAWVPLVLDPEDAPDSSLSHMVGLLQDAFAPSPSPYYLGPDGVDLDGALTRMRDARGPVIGFGTAFAWVHLLDAVERPVRLPAGSRIVETGGFKGKSRVVPRETLYRRFHDQLGVPAAACLSEYSMTELSSQLYSDTLAGGDPPRLRPPPWCRVFAVNPTDLSPLPPGREGLLRFVDLANVDTVVAIQTSDVGTVYDDGRIDLRGRAPGASPRGCSLAVEELLLRMERP